MARLSNLSVDGWLRYRELPVSTLGVEGGYDPQRSDLVQCLIDRRHGVHIIDRKAAQVSIVTDDAHSAGLLGDADDGARHRTDRRAYEAHVEQFAYLPVDL